MEYLSQPPPLECPVTSHSVRYHHLWLKSTPVLPVSEDPSLTLPLSLSMVSEAALAVDNKTSSFYLFLVSAPTPFITTSTPFTAGDNGTLSCDYTFLSRAAVDVETSTTWTKDRSPLDTSPGDGRISTDGLSLIFSPLTTVDSGSYTCFLRLTSNTSHVIIIHGRQQSSETAITVLSMSTQLHCCLCLLLSFSLSLSVPPPTVSVSLNHTGPLFTGTVLTIS